MLLSKCFIEQALRCVQDVLKGTLDCSACRWRSLVAVRANGSTCSHCAIRAVLRTLYIRARLCVKLSVSTTECCCLSAFLAGSKLSISVADVRMMQVRCWSIAEHRRQWRAVRAPGRSGQLVHAASDPPHGWCCGGSGYWIAAAGIHPRVLLHAGDVRVRSKH